MRAPTWFPRRPAPTFAAVFVVALGLASPADGQQGWSGAVHDIFAADFVAWHELAVGTDGSAVALARTLHGALHAVRRDGATTVWEAPHLLAATGTGDGLPLVGPAGDAAVIWSAPTGAATFSLRVSHYDSESNDWSTQIELVSMYRHAGVFHGALDPSGNIVVAWAHPVAQDEYVIQVSRYSALARITYVMGARYSAGADTWSAPFDIERRGDLAGDPYIVADRHGDVTIVWTRDMADDDLPFTHARRYTPSTGQVTPVAVLSAVEARDPRVGVDAAGHVLVTWTRRRSIGGVTAGIIEGTEWLASLLAPAVASIRAGSGTLTVSVTPPGTPEPAFAPTTYEYSLDDGATWTPRTPASTVSPLRIGGLTNDVTYVVRLRAVNGAGPGAPSASVAATPTAGPDPPTNLRVAAQASNTVTLAWKAPAVGVPPTAYVLEGGVQPDEVLASIPAGGPMPVPSFTFSAPTGAYYIRMHAVSGAAWSPPSNEIRIFVNVPVPPAAPTNLLGLANGSALGLSWTNPPGGPAATAMWLNVTGALTVTLPLPPAETFTYPNVPPGTYTFSMSASSAGGMSAPSNSVTLSFPSPCTGVPGIPTDLQMWTAGRTIFLAWGPSASGAAVTGYTVHVSGSYVGSFATTDRTLSGVAAPGSYTLNVVATNPCGASPATPAQTVVMP
jgi:hypothetical protein